MAQLCLDNDKFQELNTEIMVMLPNGPLMIKRYLSKNPTPFVILTDRGSRVAERYFQYKWIFSIGSPTVFLVNQAGNITYTFYGNSPLDEPGNQEVLALLPRLVFKN